MAAFPLIEISPFIAIWGATGAITRSPAVWTFTGEPIARSKNTSDKESRVLGGKITRLHTGSRRGECDMILRCILC